MHKIGHGGTHLTSWAQELHSVALDGHVESLCFSPDNSCVAVALGGAVCILSVTAERKQIFPDAHGGALVRSVHWTSSTTLATAGSATIRLWDTTRDLCTGQLESHSDVLSVTGAGDNAAWLASGAADGVVTLWRNAEEEGTCLGHEAAVNAVAFCRDGTLLVSASSDQTARIWALDGRCMAILRHRDEVRAACFGARRTASLVVTGSMDGTAMIWQLDGAGDATELAPIHVCRSHHGGITDLAIGENGQTLCTASVDKSLRLWTLQDGGFARSLPGGGALAAVAISTAGAAKIATATRKGLVKIFGIVPRGREAGMFA
eukprot:s4194_g3.t1